MRDDVVRLFEISGVWVRSPSYGHESKVQVQQLIRRILPRLKRPLARGKFEHGVTRSDVGRGAKVRCQLDEGSFSDPLVHLGESSVDLGHQQRRAVNLCRCSRLLEKLPCEVRLLLELA